MGSKTKKPRPRWSVWLDRAVYGAIAVLIIMPGGVLEHWPVARWRWLEDADVWPRLVRRDLHLYVDPPGHLQATASLQLQDIRADTFLLLLNEHLSVTSARDGAGQEVEVTHLLGTFERYHREARALRFDLDSAPPDGRLDLVLEYGGPAQSGPDGSDWRGMLYVDVGELRMTDQTVFAPQVPSAWQSPGAAGVPGIFSIDAPREVELFAPGAPTARVDVDAHFDESSQPAELAATRAGTVAPIPAAQRTLWRFDLKHAGTLALVGGRRVRHESVFGDAHLVTLLRDEHAHLGEPFLRESRAALQAYTELWGPAGAGSLGIFEMVCRDGYSYNWAANGMIAFDCQALGDDVPLAKLSHEVAHLWWGQRVAGRGDGERVLTEGLAEYASWRWLASRDPEQARRSMREAREDRASLLEHDHDAALRDVTFRSAGYTDLAYSKAPLVFRWVEHMRGTEAMDAALSDYAAAHENGAASLDELLDALGVARPGAPAEERLHAPWFEQTGDLRVSLTHAEWTPDDPSAHEARHDLPGTLSLTVQAELVGGADARFLHLDVPLRVLDADGQPTRLDVVLDGQETSLALSLSARPAAVWLDPDGMLPVPGTGLVVFDGPELRGIEPAPETPIEHGLTELVLDFDRPVVFPDDPKALRDRLREGHENRTPVILEVRSEDDGRRVVLRTRPLSPGATYELALQAAFEDQRGIPVRDANPQLVTLASDDHSAPTVVSTTPENHGHLPADAREVTLTFSETMRTMTGFKKGDIADRLDDHGWHYPPIDLPRWGDDQYVLTVPIDEPLVPGRSYCLPFGSERWEDLSGNGLEPFDFVFTVDDT